MPRYARPPVLLAYAAFVLIGIAAGGNGVLLLAQMGSYGVDRATIGVIFFTGSVGFVLAGFHNGSLIHRFGVRLALAVGGGAYALACLYLATRPPFLAFVLVLNCVMALMYFSPSRYSIGVSDPALAAAMIF